MSHADLIRAHAKERFVEVARRANQKTVTIVAGEVGRDLGMSNRMPNICQALGSRKFFDLARVDLVERTGPEAGASTRFVYAIKPSLEDAPRAREDAPHARRTAVHRRPATRAGLTPEPEQPSPSAADFAVVIQCAARKRPHAGHLTTEDDKPVLFVANPQTAPQRPGVLYRRPDDTALSTLSWRDVLVQYNEVHGGGEENPLGLLPAWRLYADSTYEHLADRLGDDSLFILSAGWGLIPAGYLTPNYDITFAADAEDHKRRRAHERYADFSMLPKDSSRPIHFLGGKSYVSLFCRLTEGTSAERIVHHVGEPPHAPNCRTVRFETLRRTNWHYECARKLR